MEADLLRIYAWENLMITINWVLLGSEMLRCRIVAVAAQMPYVADLEKLRSWIRA